MIKKYFMWTFRGTSIIYEEQGKLNAEIQMMNGKAREYVYFSITGDKISYLDWKIKNVTILRLGYD